MDGSEFDTEEKETAVPIDLILHGMWSSVDIKMNHTLVSTSGTDYMYKSLIETLLNYNDRAKRNQLCVQLDFQENQEILLKLTLLLLHLIMA